MEEGKGGETKPAATAAMEENTFEALERDFQEASICTLILCRNLDF